MRERLAGILGLLRELEQSSSGLDYVLTLLRYLAQGASTDRLTGDELRQAVTQALRGGGELMLTIAEQWVQEGRQEGRREGRQEGRQEGEARLLRRLLVRRFGAVPEWVEAKLAGASLAELEAWGERVLDTKTLEAVFTQE